MRRRTRAWILVGLGVILALTATAPVFAAAARDSFDSKPDIYESDGTASTAHHLALGENEVHSLYPSGDVDWFSIDADDSIHAVRVFGGGSHITYAVYDASGREIKTGTATERDYVYSATFEVGGTRTPHGPLRFKITSAPTAPEGTGYGIVYLAQSPLPAESGARTTGMLLSALGLSWVVLVIVAFVRVIAMRDTGGWRRFLLVALWSQAILALLPGGASLVIGVIGLISYATGQMKLDEGANGLYLAVSLGYGIVLASFGAGNLAIIRFIAKRRSPLPDVPTSASPGAAEHAHQADGQKV